MKAVVLALSLIRGFDAEAQGESTVVSIAKDVTS